MLGYYENDDGVFTPQGENTEFREMWEQHIDYTEDLEGLECLEAEEA